MGKGVVVAGEIEVGVDGSGGCGVTGKLGSRNGRIRLRGLSGFNGYMPVPENPDLIVLLEKAWSCAL